jgi:uncharacterized protein YecE (DUF72 family)
VLASLIHDLRLTIQALKMRIGTSGFGIGQAKYVQLFCCIEVQHTPAIATLERWRAAAPPDFEFVLKAWQLITHDAKSPTYRRLKKNLSEVEKQEAGYFRPTAVVKEAWEVTLACANALKAGTILFQCPASFKQTKENIQHLTKFFSRINRKSKTRGLNLCWEPRGDWDPKVVQTICDDLNLWHVVDPFVAESVTPHKLYYRLHGRNGWRYQYDDGELRELAAMLLAARSNRDEVATDSSSTHDSGVTIHDPYVFFNNVSMTRDASTFQAIVQAS